MPDPAANPPPAPGADPAAGAGSAVVAPVLSRGSGLDREAPSAPASSALLIGLFLLAPLTLAVLWRRRVIGPGTLRHTGVQPDERTAGRLMATGVALYAWHLLVTSLVALGLGAGSASAGSTGPDVSRQGVLALVVYGLAAPAAVLAFGLVVGRGALTRRPTRDVALGLGTLALAWPTIVAASALAAWLATHLRGAAPDPIAHATLRVIVDSDNPWRWGLIAGATIGAPMVEEVIYRGLLQRGLVAALGKPGLAVGVTAGLFALVHAASVPWHALVTLFVLGLALGIVTQRTGRLLPGMVAHAGFNAANIGLALWGGGGGA